MDFEVVWAYLRKNPPSNLKTSGGTPFTVEVSDTSIAYKSEGDQRRPQTKDNFEKYLRMWLREGRPESSSFSNLTKKKSRSARGRYFREVFRYLETDLGAGLGV